MQKNISLVVITSLISYAIGYPFPSYFQLVLGGVSFYNFKEKGLSMEKAIMKAVGAVAAVRSESSYEGEWV